MQENSLIDKVVLRKFIRESLEDRNQIDEQSLIVPAILFSGYANAPDICGDVYSRSTAKLLATYMGFIILGEAAGALATTAAVEAAAEGIAMNAQEMIPIIAKNVGPLARAVMHPMTISTHFFLQSQQKIWAIQFSNLSSEEKARESYKEVVNFAINVFALQLGMRLSGPPNKPFLNVFDESTRITIGTMEEVKSLLQNSPDWIKWAAKSSGIIFTGATLNLNKDALSENIINIFQDPKAVEIARRLRLETERKRVKDDEIKELLDSMLLPEDDNNMLIGKTSRMPPDIIPFFDKVETLPCIRDEIKRRYNQQMQLELNPVLPTDSSGGKPNV